MKAAIVIFPGSNREHDVALAWKRATGNEPARLWHRDAELPATDLIILPGGFGTRHAPLVWNVAEDDAAVTLDAVAGGQTPWGLLFWVSLMAGGGEEAVIGRWKEVVAQVVPDRRVRGNLAGIALVFAELVGRRVGWKRGLEGFDMTESQVVNEWISQGEARGRLQQQRQNVLKLLGKPRTLIRHVEDRPGHDRRYAVDSSQIRAATGWTPRVGFEAGMADTVEWFRARQDWWRPIKEGEFRAYYERMYGQRKVLKEVQA